MYICLDYTLIFLMTNNNNLKQNYNLVIFYKKKLILVR